MANLLTKDQEAARLAKAKADQTKVKRSKFGKPTLVAAETTPPGKPAPAEVVGDQKPVKGEDQKTAPTGDKKKREPSDTVKKWKEQENFPLTAKITVVATENPKRRGAATRFAIYKDGMTVGDYIEASHKAGASKALAAADVRWDHVAGFINVK